MTRSYSEDQEREIWKEIDALDKRVQYEFVDQLLDYASLLLAKIEECESPIEQLFALSLNRIADQIEKRYGVDCIVNPQSQIEVRQKTYRVDFLIAIQMKDGTGFRIAVECDGHEFHEKTKEQAARDKARDRAIQSQAIPVLRFTGSEIWNNPWQCAKEVREFIESYLRLDGGDFFE